MKAQIVKILDQLIFGLTLCYALVSCWELNTVPATFVSVALILAAGRHYLSPVNIQFSAPLKLAIGLYWATLLLSAAAAYPDVRVSQVWSFMDRMLTLPLVLICCRSRRQLVLLTVCIMISAFVADFVGIYQFWNNPLLRVQSIFAHPVHFGEHILLAGSFLLPLATLNIPGAPRPLRAFFVLTLLLSIIAMIFNQTRAVWIAGSVVWIALIVLSGRRTHSFLAASLSLCLIIGISFTCSPVLQSRLSSITSDTYQSNTERLRIWESARMMIADHPLLGVGPDNFGEKYQTRYMLPAALERFQRDAHNSYLSTAAELGLLGLCAFLYMLWTLLATFYRRLRTAEEPAWPMAGFFVVLAFCVYGTMNSMINSFWAVRLFWLLIGISLAADNFSRQPLQQSIPPNP